MCSGCMNCQQRILMFKDSGNTVLAVDIGTSGCRAILFSKDGIILSESQEKYTFVYNIKGYAQQDPIKIFNSFIFSINKCLSNYELSPEYIIVGSVLHSLVLLDENGTPLTPLSIWADTRAIEQCKTIENHYLCNNWYQKTGCLLSPSYPLFRFLWYKENHPELVKNFAKAVSIKSFIFFKLFGYYIEDYSVASGTGLFNIHNFDWDDDILGFIELDRKRLPTPVPVEHKIAPLSLTKKKEFGINDKSTWIIGSSDGPLAHLGTVGHVPEVASLTIGTSGSVRIISKKPELSKKSLEWCYVLDSTSYVLGIATNNGGNVIDWFEDVFNFRIDWQKIDTILETTQFNPNLFFSPFVFQERYLNSQPDNAGSFIGLQAGHNSNDLLRAVMEGIIFNIVFLFNELKQEHKINQVVTSGNLTELPFIGRMLSLLIREPVISMPKSNASLIGAARIIFGTDFDVVDKNQIKYRSNNFNLTNNPYYDKFLKWTQKYQNNELGAGSIRENLSSRAKV
jgi:gluconokinase